MIVTRDSGMSGLFSSGFDVTGWTGTDWIVGSILGYVMISLAFPNKYMKGPTYKRK